MRDEEKGLETLQVWQKALALAKRIHKEVLPLLPSEEKWAMSQQLRRAAQSVPANIAEGYGRYYFQETIRFCYIARGSLEETYTFLKMAVELNYLEQEEFNSLKNEVKDVSRLINGYIAFLKRNRRGENEPGAFQVRESGEQYDIEAETIFPDSELPE